MAITTRAQLTAAIRSGQLIDYTKTATRSPVVVNYNSIFDVAGSFAGTLAGTSTTQGVVPDDSTAGCPPIDAFGPGQTGYIASVEWSLTVQATSQGRFMLSDLLFKSGAHAFNATDVLASQPSYAARIPGGDYKGTEIWLEWVTASTGNPVVTVTYTDDKGNTGQTTSFTYAGTTAIGQMRRMDLAAPSEGVQKIESVTCTVASAGTFNVLVLRPLLRHMQATGPNGPIVYRGGPDVSALPIVFDTSALYVHTLNASTAGMPLTMTAIIARG